MPNWADTHYIIKGNPTSKIVEALNNLDDLNWEGSILEYLGYEIDKDAFMRGFIDFWKMDGETLDIYAEEAWAYTDFARSLLNLFEDDDSFNIEFTCEEPGLNVYVKTYDEDLYKIQSEIEGELIIEYFNNKKDMDLFCKEVFNMSLEEAENWESEDDDYIYIIEFETVDI